MLLFLNVIYVLIAIAMVALILMQRGAGAQAGSGFGGGASSTVFGSRGSANFLSKATKWLAITFFAISLFMAWQATRSARAPSAVQSGVMSQVPAAPAPAGNANAPVPTAPAAQAPATDAAVPVAPAAQPQTEPSRQPEPATGN